jgi:hypothetical protein
MVISLITAKLKPFTFAVSGVPLSYAAKMFILMILYDLRLLPANCVT